jgi:hypothetical protein
MAGECHDLGGETTFGVMNAELVQSCSPLTIDDAGRVPAPHTSGGRALSIEEWATPGVVTRTQ